MKRVFKVQINHMLGYFPQVGKLKEGSGKELNKKLVDVPKETDEEDKKQ